MITVTFFHSWNFPLFVLSEIFDWPYDGPEAPQLPSDGGPHRVEGQLLNGVLALLLVEAEDEAQVGDVVGAPQLQGGHSAAGDDDVFGFPNLEREKNF